MRTEDVQLYSGTVTGTGNSGEDRIDVKGVCEAVFFLDVTAVSGTDPTLTVRVMTHDTIGDKWYLIENFDSISSPSSDIKRIIGGLGSYIACKWVVGGENPSFTFTLNASMKD